MASEGRRDITSAARRGAALLAVVVVVVDMATATGTRCCAVNCALASGDDTRLGTGARWV